MKNGLAFMRLLAIFVLGVLHQGFGAIPASERSALISLYNATNGAGWTNSSGWKTPPLDTDGFAMPGTENTWYGIYLNGDSSHVISVFVNNNHLVGTIPSQLGDIAYLELLHLEDNQLSGNIPTSLGGLTKLKYLWLRGNQLSGAIPSELGNLPDLEEFYLESNQLTGMIPASFGNLTKLKNLWLMNNQLTGSIPSQLGNLSDLVTLVLLNNKLSGTIPQQLGSLSKLRRLLLNDNQLSGGIPSQLGGLSQLVDLWLHRNQLTGVIPSELGSLASLQELILEDNQLTGSIPSSLGGLSHLRRLLLSRNQLSGAIPNQLGSLTNLEDLRIYTNQLTGNIPSSLGSLAKLRELWLKENQLSGGIPVELAGLGSLQLLTLSNNQLTGGIPSQIGSLAQVQILEVAHNQLTGGIPSSLGSLSQLKILSLDYNQLSNTIPLELGNLLNLEYLYLNDNQLNGSIPSSLGSLSILKALLIGKNQLTGTIPIELGNLSKLEYLSLNDNQLTGSIPSSLGNLSNVKWITLYGNQLSGPLPSSLGNLSNLEGLYAGWMQLSGSIPSSFGNLTKLKNLGLDGDRLTGVIPPEFGNLSSLEYLWLSYNQLSGNIPQEFNKLTHMKALYLAGNQLKGEISNFLNTDWSLLQELDLAYNGLFTSDPTMQSFLDAKDPDWALTQTVAPTNIQAIPLTRSIVNVTWTPISYTGHTGGYRVYVGTASGGPYTYFGQTADKASSSLQVTGLSAGLPYYFVVQTRTDPHDAQLSTLDSNYSREATATTPTGLTVSFLAGNGGSLSGTTTQTVILGGSCTPVQANPDIGYVFVNWTGTGGFTSTANPLTVTNVTNDMIITANFVTSGNGLISGRVTDGGGNGISNVRVEVDNLSYILVVAVLSDGDGSYSVSVAPGTYRLRFQTNTNSFYATEWYNNKKFMEEADNVTVVSGQATSGINAVLEIGGNVSGRVTDSLGNGIANINVAVTENTVGWGIVFASTDSAGYYTTNGVLPGNYKVWFMNNALKAGFCIEEWYSNKSDHDTADSITVTASQTTANIDAQLEEGGNISGRVTDMSGNPIQGILLDYYKADNTYVFHSPTHTDVNGDYTIRGLPAGGYKVNFYTNLPYVSEWYNNKNSLDDADIVNVTVDQTTAGINAQLAPAGSISGRVIDEGGAGIQNIQVRIYDLSYAYKGYAYTDGNGDYLATGFPTGVYKVYFYGYLSDYVPEWFNGKSSFGTADPVSVVAGQTTANISAQLEAKTISLISPNGGESWVSGSIHDITWTSSLGVGNVKIAYSTDGGSSYTDIIASTANDGVYSWMIPDAPSTNCLVRISESDGSPSDTSDSVFAITPIQSASVTLISPNGGESLTVGATYSITWSSTGVVGNVKIEYSIDSGTHYSEVVASTANDGSFTWTVANTPSTACLVRVSETDGSPSDTSNSTFTIALAAPPAVNGLAVDFGSAGFWIWDNYVWTQVSGVNPDGLAAADMDGDGAAEIVVDFGTVGAWLLDGTAWTQLSGVNADGFIAADTDGDGADELVGDFGTTGLWLWNLTWTQLSGVNADGMIAADTDGDGTEEIIGDFGTTGLWMWKSGVWTQMSGVNAEGMIAANVDPAASREIIADFGTIGLWLLKGGAWTQLSGVNAEGLAAGRLDADAEEEAVVDFGSLSVWVYDAGTWSLVSGANADQLVIANVTADADDEIVADFGAIGIYVWDSGSWVNISSVNPELLVAANLDLDQEIEVVADFGGLGLWVWNNGVWNQISSTNPENVIAKY